VKKILQEFGNNSVQKIEILKNLNLTQRFSKAWNSKQYGTPVFVFHGTASKNIISIRKNGLMVPGIKYNLILGTGGVHVVNGSAYGVGIYLAMDASYSMSYCNGDNQMFACAVLCGKSGVTTKAGDIIVSFKNELVLPCFLITFENKNSGHYKKILPTHGGQLVKIKYSLTNPNIKKILKKNY
jgi:hypothetical protein